MAVIGILALSYVVIGALSVCLLIYKSKKAPEWQEAQGELVDAVGTKRARKYINFMLLMMGMMWPAMAAGEVRKVIRKVRGAK